MPDPVVPVPLVYVEPPQPDEAAGHQAAPDGADASMAAEGSGMHAPAGGVPAPLRDAARRLLESDGTSIVLQPWQAAYLVATSEGRQGFVPPGCGVGKGWLEARLEEARLEPTEPASSGAASGDPARG